MTKSFWASKTIWLNLIAGLIAIVAPILDSGLVKSNPSLVVLFTTILAVLNLLLRTFSTATPIVPPSTGSGTL